MKIYEFKVNESELQVIAYALGKLPFETVANVIANIQAQVTEQQESKESGEDNGKAAE